MTFTFFSLSITANFGTLLRIALGTSLLQSQNFLTDQ